MAAIKASTALRVSVVAEWSLVAATVALSLLREDLLPEPLRDWVADEATRESTGFERGLLVVSVVALIAHLAASVGLLQLRRWAAWLYLATTALVYVIAAFLGPTVDDALGATVSELATAFSGAVIALAFFTDALQGGAKQA